MSNEPRAARDLKPKVVPQGRGKAAALAEYLSDGGGLDNSDKKKGGFRYTDGRHKGKTQAEAVSVFEKMWAGASPQQKDKYAKREQAEAVLAPSEMGEYQKDVDQTDRWNEGAMGGEAADAEGNSTIYGGGKIKMNSGTSVEANKSETASTPRIPVPMRKSDASVNASASEVRTEGNQTAGTPSRLDLIKAGRVGTEAEVANKPPIIDRQIPAIAPRPMQDRFDKLNPAIQEAAKNKMAVNAAPTGKPVVATLEDVGGKKQYNTITDSVGNKSRINPLTGLPFGHMPGDKVPEGGDQAMANRADQSTRRMNMTTQKIQETNRIAATPKTPVNPTGYPGPKTSYHPTLGYVPVAAPVKTGEEIISYDKYAKARDTPRLTSATTELEDKQNVAIEMEFGRQETARQKLPGGSLADDYNRSGSGRKR